MTTTNTHTRATLVSHVLALSPPPPPPPNAPGRIGSDRIGISGAKPTAPRPNFFPMVCLRHPRHVVTSSCSRFVSRPLGSENWTLGTKLDLTSPSKETNFSPSCVTCWVFLVLVFFKRRRPPNTAFPTLLFRLKCQKLLDWGRRRNGTVALDPFTFLGVFSRRISWNMYHVCSSLSLLFVVTDSCRCQILSEGSEVLEIWMCFYFWFIFFNVFATLSPRWVCWFYLPCLVSICVSPPPTYRTIFLKSLISVFIHTFFSFFLVKFGPCGLYSLHKLLYIVFYGEFYFRLRAWRLPL